MEAEPEDDDTLMTRQHDANMRKSVVFCGCLSFVLELMNEQVASRKQVMTSHWPRPSAMTQGFPVQAPVSGWWRDRMKMTTGLSAGGRSFNSRVYIYSFIVVLQSIYCDLL